MDLVNMSQQSGRQRETECRNRGGGYCYFLPHSKHEVMGEMHQAGSWGGRNGKEGAGRGPRGLGG